MGRTSTAVDLNEYSFPRTHNAKLFSAHNQDVRGQFTLLRIHPLLVVSAYMRPVTAFRA